MSLFSRMARARRLIAAAPSPPPETWPGLPSRPQLQRPGPADLGHMRGPVDCRFDPCGAGPIESGETT